MKNLRLPIGLLAHNSRPSSSAFFISIGDKRKEIPARGKNAVGNETFFCLLMVWSNRGNLLTMLGFTGLHSSRPKNNEMCFTTFFLLSCSEY
jgi:hypothetical protein